MTECYSIESDFIGMELYINALTTFFGKASDIARYWYSVLKYPFFSHSLSDLLGVSNDRLMEVFIELKLVENIKNRDLQVQQQNFKNF